MTVKMTMHSVAVRITLPLASPRSRIVVLASAKAMAPLKPLTKSIFVWFSGTRRAGRRFSFTHRMTGNTFNARPPAHATIATATNGTIDHFSSSRNIATPMYMNTNVSARVARTLNTTLEFVAVSGLRFGTV